MVGEHHQLNGHELGQTLGDSEGQGAYQCCSPRGRKVSDTTWRLNNSNNPDRIIVPVVTVQISVSFQVSQASF